MYARYPTALQRREAGLAGPRQLDGCGVRHLVACVDVSHMLKTSENGWDSCVSTSNDRERQRKRVRGRER